MAQRLLNRARYYQRVVQRRLGRHALIARTDTATRLVREADEPIARVVSVVSHADRFDQALPPILTRTAAARVLPERTFDTVAPAALPVAPVSAQPHAAEESVAPSILPQNLPNTRPFQAQPPLAEPAPAQDAAFPTAAGQPVLPRAVAPPAAPTPEFGAPAFAQAASASEAPRTDAPQTLQRSAAPVAPPAAHPAVDVRREAPMSPFAAPSAAAQPVQPAPAQAAAPLVTPEAVRPVAPVTPAPAPIAQPPVPSDTLQPRSAPVWSMPLDTPPPPQAAQMAAQDARVSDVTPEARVAVQPTQPSATAAANIPSTASEPAAAAPTGPVRLSDLTKMIKGMMRRPNEGQQPSAPDQAVPSAPVQSAPPVTPSRSPERVDVLPAESFVPAPEQAVSAAPVQPLAADQAQFSGAPEQAAAPQQVMPQPAPQQFVPPQVPAAEPVVVPQATPQQFVPPVPQQFVLPQVPAAEPVVVPQATPQQFVPPVPQQFVPPQVPAAEPVVVPQATPQQFVPQATPQQFVPPAPQMPAAEPVVVPQATPQQFVPPAPQQFVPPQVPPQVRPVETPGGESAVAPQAAPQVTPDQAGDAGADGVPLSELTKMIKGMMRSANDATPSTQAAPADAQTSAPEQIQRAATSDAQSPEHQEPELPTVSTMKTASGQEVEVRRPRGRRPQITPRPRPPEASQPETSQAAPATKAPEPEPEGQFRFNMDPNKDRSPEAWRQRLIAMAQFEREQAARRAGLQPPAAPVSAEPASQAAPQGVTPAPLPQYQTTPQAPAQPVVPAPQVVPRPVQSAQPVTPAQPVVPQQQVQPAVPQQMQPAAPQQAQTPATVQRQPATEPASDDRSPQAWAARLFRQPRDTEQTPTAQTPSSEAAPTTPVVPGMPVGPVTPSPAPAPDAFGEAEGEYGPEASDGEYAAPAQGTLAEDGQDVPASARVAIQDSSPTPLPETTRRFLRPLVGIDPADVRIYQGALANQVAAEFNADAVTVGEDVFLAAGNSDSSPSTLGVLAHELTHVARQRETQFVPPMAAQQTNTAPGEEQLAESVEATVLQRARSIEQQQAQLPPGSAPLLESDGSQGDSAAVRSAWAGTPFQPSAPEPQQAQPRSVWGNLPAPWEPLPDWMNTSAQDAGSREVQSLGLESVFSPTPPAALSTSMSGLNGGAQPAVQLAEVGRSVESNTTEPAASGGGEEQGKAPEPDLDALARQVYSLLKQRLAAERRRSEI
ncbi:MAG: hypothetical protein OHK0022_15330 [Roseiflexaceae bacterium]